MRQGYASSDNYTVCYYITNLQGDVIRLVDIYGQIAAMYQYDPYGNVIQALGSHSQINPLRYRGYYYDNDTGMYYLQSRYYDPKIGRFINADGMISTGQGFLGNNMFSYCLSNPVNRTDAEGAISYDCKDEDVNDDDNTFNDAAKIGNTIQIGSGHGNPHHRNFIDSLIKKLVNSGSYEKVFGNRALSTAGQVGAQRPDIIAIGTNGLVEAWEIASPSQAIGTTGYDALQFKIEIMQAANPNVVFHEIIPWESIKE